MSIILGLQWLFNVGYSPDLDPAKFGISWKSNNSYFKLGLFVK